MRPDPNYYALVDEERTLTTQVAELDAELQQILHNPDGTLRNLPRAEQRAFDDKFARREEVSERIGELRREIQRREQVHARAVELARSPSNIEHGSDRGSFEHMRRVAPFNGDDVTYLPHGTARDRALALVDRRDPASDHLRDEQREQFEKLVRSTDDNCDGSYIAKRALISESPEYRSAWAQLVTMERPLLSNDEVRAIRALKDLERAMNIGTDSAGGFGVPVLIDPTIVHTSQQSLNPFRRISRVETITTDEWKGVSSAGVTWSFDAEAAEVSDDSPTLAQPTVTAHMARGFVPFSIEVGSDYPRFAEEMTRLLAEGYDELQSEKFATGTGTGQPFGIITALDANTNVEVAVTTDGAFGGVDINKVWGALPDRAKNRATWVMHHDVGNEVATFGNGNNLSFVTVDLTGVVQTLRQRPVENSSYFPEFTGTTGAANILVVGDFSRYLIAQRAGLNVELVPHLVGTNRRPTGQRGLFAWARVGADSIDDDSFRMLQNT